MQMAVTAQSGDNNVNTIGEGMSLRLRWLLWIGLVVGALMLLAVPLDKPVWDDELDSIMQGSKPYMTILAGASDTQPPLHFLVLRLCQTLGGGNLAVYRFVSALPAVISLWYVYLLGKRLSPRIGVLAVWLAALSPGIVLFDRMARYHGLLAMLATMSVYYWLTGLDQGRRRDFLAYAVTTFMMLITYYLSLFVLVAQVIFLLFRWRAQPFLKPALAAMAVAIIVFLPWFLHGLLLAQHNIQVSHVEDPAMSLGVNGFIRRLGLPVYAFCLGETVYPWSWPIVLLGCPAVLGAFWLGTNCLKRKPEVLLAGVVLAVLVLSALATSGKLGSGQTVGSMSKRVSFVLPLFYVVLSAGLFSLRAKAPRNLWICLLFVPAIYGVFNYWTNQQFLNPNYIAPWSQAITTMQQRQWGQDTLVLSCADPALHYYLDRQSSPVLHANVGSFNDVKQAVESDNPHYIWLVGRDRGDQLRKA